MVMRRGVSAAIAALAMTLSLITAVRADAHPLHTTLTEIAVTPNTLRATVRIFADDLGHAVGSRTDDLGIGTYVASAMVFLDGQNRAIAARSCGVKRAGDLLWVCIEVTDARPMSLRNTLLCEQFRDQINIVQIAAGGTKRGLVFTRGDGPKRLL